MRLEITPNGKTQGYYTIVPFGPIDSETHHQFKEEIKKVLKPETKGLLLNLKNVEYISSAGLGALFSIEKYLSENQALLAFCNLQPQIEKLFAGVQMLPKNVLFKSLQEADDYFYSIMDDEIRRQKSRKPDSSS